MVQFESFRETFPPEKIRDVPLCMDQFKLLFSTCRVPGEIVDESKAVILSSSTFVTVIHNDQIYQVPVYHSNGEPCPISEIEG